MRKILAVFILIILFSPSALAKKAKVVVPQGSGYVGTLPKIEDRFPQPVQQETSPSFEYKDGFNDPDAIKPAPRNNPAFINIITKQDKTSQYINDLNDLITIVEKLEDDIENSSNVQQFNAESYFLKKNVEYFRDKYKNKAEASYISYNKVMQLNTHIQSVALLRQQRENYSPYVTEAQSGNMFSANNIDNQLNYLLDDIKSTLVVLKEAK